MKKTNIILTITLLMASSVFALPPVVDEASWLFDEAKLPVFEMSVAPKDWEWLQVNAREEKPVQARLLFEGKDLGRVGLRYKGSYGTLYPCLGEDGRPTKCKKVSFKLDFGLYDKKLRFYGLKTLNLNSMHYNEAWMRERLAYWFFRESGIPAPRTNYARLTVNGRPMGVFLMVEQVDRRFLMGRFGNADGILYKEAWPVSGDAKSYADKEKDAPKGAPLGAPKAAKEPAPETRHAAILAFRKDLVSADKKDAEEVLGRWVDLDALMRFMAVDFAVRNYDGPTAFYCVDSPDCGNHNYYWYWDPGTSRFVLIPWDLDYTFRLQSDYNRVPDWNSGDCDCDKRYRVFGKEQVMGPSCDPLFRLMAAVDPRVYREKLKEVLEGPLKEGVPEARIAEWADVVREAVKEDEFGPGLTAWEGSVEMLRKEMSILRDLVKAEMKGETLEPMELSLDGANGFEEATDLQVKLGVNGMCNARSSLDYGLNRKHALDGRRDFKAGFTFRDEGEGPGFAWKQWCVLQFPLSGSQGSADMSGGWRLRFRVASDKARTLRVNLESDQYVEDNTMTGELYGWDVQVGPDEKKVELDLAAAAYPGWARIRPPVTQKDVLGHVTGLQFDPQAVGRTGQGLFPPGREDEGFLQVDDVEFVGP